MSKSIFLQRKKTNVSMTFFVTVNFAFSEISTENESLLQISPAYGVLQYTVWVFSMLCFVGDDERIRATVVRDAFLELEQWCRLATHSRRRCLSCRALLLLLQARKIFILQPSQPWLNAHAGLCYGIYIKSRARVRLLDFMCLALWILITRRRKLMVSRARPNFHQTLMANVLTFRATAREKSERRAREDATGSGTYGGRERKFISDECIVSSATCALRIHIRTLFDLEKERGNIVHCVWKRVVCMFSNERKIFDNGLAHCVILAGSNLSANARFHFSIHVEYVHRFERQQHQLLYRHGETSSLRFARHTKGKKRPLGFVNGLYTRPRLITAKSAASFYQFDFTRARRSHLFLSDAVRAAPALHVSYNKFPISAHIHVYYPRSCRRRRHCCYIQPESQVRATTDMRQQYLIKNPSDISPRQRAQRLERAEIQMPISYVHIYTYTDTIMLLDNNVPGFELNMYTCHFDLVYRVAAAAAVCAVHRIYPLLAQQQQQRQLGSIGHRDRSRRLISMCECSPRKWPGVHTNKRVREIARFRIYKTKCAHAALHRPSDCCCSLGYIHTPARRIRTDIRIYYTRTHCDDTRFSDETIWFRKRRKFPRERASRCTAQCCRYTRTAGRYIYHTGAARHIALTDRCEKRIHPAFMIAQ
ncbi:unnamed protein product [Trichogramma brassicae]|uniref:Uncharacterized protein n=1 Tax=Trichogramma brassicae TaxID=86971 RepID=A0A6H5IJC1_9HYME|nr:unnamed protein product [Trichogramma brassicae]